MGENGEEKQSMGRSRHLVEENGTIVKKKKIKNQPYKE